MHRTEKIILDKKHFYKSTCQDETGRKFEKTILTIFEKTKNFSQKQTFRKTSFSSRTFCPRKFWVTDFSR